MPLQRRMPKVGFRSRHQALARRGAPGRARQGGGRGRGSRGAAEGGRRARRGTERAKVVLSGEIKKAVTLKGVAATTGARAAIEAAGGKVEA